MNRRQFLRQGARLAIGGGAIAAFAAAYCCTIRREDVVLPGLRPSFDGFRVAFLSDFHHGPWFSQQYLRAVVDEANRLQPDLIVLAGDYIHDQRSQIEGCFTELSRLRAPHGVLAVLGNHDHADGAGPFVRQAISRVGWTDLTNTGVSVPRDGEDLWIGGVGDLWCEKQRTLDALSGARRERSVLLLSHNPDYTESVRDERVGLILSGHTHGGQCCFPVIGAPLVPSRYGQKYLSGLCLGPSAPVFVTRGVGSLVPVRFACPPEIALLTLRGPRSV